MLDDIKEKIDNQITRQDEIRERIEGHYERLKTAEKEIAD